MKRKKVIIIVAVILVAVVGFCVIAGIIGKQRSQGKKQGAYVYTDQVRTIEDTDNQGIGDVEITTLKLDKRICVRRATYSFSGRVLISYTDGSDTVIVTMDDNGSNMLEIFRGKIPSGYRLLPFQDNTRILIGDYILECPDNQNLDNCKKDSAILVPLEYPSEIVDDPQVYDKWTEPIISPDCKHLAWTLQRKDCGTSNAMGILTRKENKYVIEDAQYISNLTGYQPDPNHAGELTYTPIIGGEVKQFVHGGDAISLITVDTNGMGDSAIQDIATGKITRITAAPGYDETTILSPDEKLGITMTTRFSEETNLGVIGLVPRPYGDPVQNILGQVVMYGVVGVRSGRAGNIGPALINIEQSTNDQKYTGLDLSDPEEKFIFQSPLSWNDKGDKAMWVERQKDGKVRVQIARLLDYKPKQAIEGHETPVVGDYGKDPNTVVNVSGSIQGKVSGSMHIDKKKGFLGNVTITIVYDHYSDDGVVYYDGTEYSIGNMFQSPVYKADITVTDANGKQLGYMDTELHFSPAYTIGNLFSGQKYPRLDTSKSHGTAEWKGIQADTSHLVP